MLAFNSLWILGCSILLAQFSITQWAKQQQVTQQSSKNRLMISVFAYALIGIGVIVVNEAIWQKGMWGIVTLLLIGGEYLNYKSTL